MATRISVQLVRLYIQIQQVTINGNTANSIINHVICFSDTAGSVSATAISAALPLLSEGIQKTLQLALLAPVGLHDLLRRCTASLSNIKAKASDVFAILKTLKALHPLYATIDLNELDTIQEREAIDNVHNRICSTAMIISDTIALEVGNIAIGSVASVATTTTEAVTNIKEDEILDSIPIGYSLIAQRTHFSMTDDTVQTEACDAILNLF